MSYIIYICIYFICMYIYFSDGVSNVQGQTFNKAIQQFKEQWDIYNWTQYI